MPGEAFGAPGYFRMSYAMADEDMVEGMSAGIAEFAAGTEP